MSWRKELRDIGRERDKLIRRDIRLRTDLKWQFAHTLMYFQLADQIFSVVGRLVGGRRGRRAKKR